MVLRGVGAGNSSCLPGGFNVRKYKQKLLIKPSKANIKRLLNKVRDRIKSQPTVSAAVLIRQLNPIIRGWANYYRHVVSKSAFSLVDNHIFKAIYRWIKRKHQKKNAKWLKRRYFTVLSHLALLAKNLKFKKNIINRLKNRKTVKYARCDRTRYFIP